MLDCFIIDANLLKMGGKLGQVPLAGRVLVVFVAAIGSCVLDVLVVLLVDRVVGEMDILFAS